MSSIQDMVDVNTIIGEPIETSNNMVIIPISKVGFGFAAGGSEFRGETVDEYKRKEKEEAIQYRLPFGGGSGAGVSITPVAFLVIQSNNVKLLPVSHCSAVDKLLDYVPDLIEKVNAFANKSMQNKKEEKKEENKRLERAQKDLKEQMQQREKREKQEAKEQKELKEKVEELEEDVSHIHPTGRVRAKRAKMPPKPEVAYEYEYDETTEEFDD